MNLHQALVKNSEILKTIIERQDGLLQSPSKEQHEIIFQNSDKILALLQQFLSNAEPSAVEVTEPGQEELEQENQQLYQQVADLQRQLSEVRKESVNQPPGEQPPYLQMIEQLNSRVKELLEANDKLKGENKLLRKKEDAAMEELSQLGARNESLTARCRQLESELAQQQNRCEQLLEQSSAREQQLQKQQQEVERLSQRTVNLQHECNENATREGQLQQGQLAGSQKDEGNQSRERLNLSPHSVYEEAAQLSPHSSARRTQIPENTSGMLSKVSQKFNDILVPPEASIQLEKVQRLDIEGLAQEIAEGGNLTAENDQLELSDIQDEQKQIYSAHEEEGTSQAYEERIIHSPDEKIQMELSDSLEEEQYNSVVHSNIKPDVSEIESSVNLNEQSSNLSDNINVNIPEEDQFANLRLKIKTPEHKNILASASPLVMQEENLINNVKEYSAEISTETIETMSEMYQENTQFVVLISMGFESQLVLKDNEVLHSCIRLKRTVNGTNLEFDSKQIGLVKFAIVYLKQSIEKIILLNSELEALFVQSDKQSGSINLKGCNDIEHVFAKNIGNCNEIIISSNTAKVLTNDNVKILVQ